MAINAKLLNLLALRDAMLEEESYSSESEMLKKQFRQVNNFETKFYDTIMKVFSDLSQVAHSALVSLVFRINLVLVSAYSIRLFFS